MIQWLGTRNPLALGWGNLASLGLYLGEAKGRKTKSRPNTDWAVFIAYWAPHMCLAEPSPGDLAMNKASRDLPVPTELVVTWGKWALTQWSTNAGSVPVVLGEVSEMTQRQSP